MCILFEIVQSSQHGHLYARSDAEMIVRAGQSANPYNCVHAKVFTDVFTLLLIPYFTRSASHGHLTAGFCAKADMELPVIPRKCGHLVQCDRQKRLKSSTHANTYALLGTLLQFEKSHVLNITTVVATMMYDSSVFSPPTHIANTCNLCLTFVS